MVVLIEFILKKKDGDYKISNNITKIIEEEKFLGINKFETYLDFS